MPLIVESSSLASCSCFTNASQCAAVLCATCTRARQPQATPARPRTHAHARKHQQTCVHAPRY